VLKKGGEQVIPRNLKLREYRKLLEGCNLARSANSKNSKNRKNYTKWGEGCRFPTEERGVFTPIGLGVGISLERGGVEHFKVERQIRHMRVDIAYSAAVHVRLCIRRSSADLRTTMSSL